MRKLLSLISILSFIIIAVSATTQAWTPTDFSDSICIDLKDFGKVKDLIRLGQGGKKICGCKKCTVDAFLYNRLEDYIDMLEIEFNELREPKISPLKGFLAIFGLPTKSETAFENEAKLNNLKIILEDISKEIENKNFIKANFFLVSTNCDPNGPPDAIAQFATNDGIPAYKNNYDEKYFNNVRKKKIIPFLNKVKAMIKNKNNNIGEIMQ